MASNTGQSSTAELSDADLMLLDTFENSNTKKSTQWALTTWTSWHSEKSKDPSSPKYVPALANLVEMNKPEIDKYMAQFVEELKRAGGEDYPMDSIKGIVFGMQRYVKAYALYHNSEPVCIIGNEYHFPKFNKAFKDKKKAVKEKMRQWYLDKKRAQGISIAQEEALWDMGIFGCHTTRALSDTVFFYVTKIFGVISGTSLRLLKIEHFQFSEDQYGKYVELDKKFSMEEINEQLYNRCHGIEVLSGALRHYCDASNPRSFYNILKFYIERLTEVKRQDSYLFITPKDDTRFAATAVGRNMLQQKFAKIMRSARVDGYYTNQSLVQSIGARLQAKGYNVKKQRIFRPLDHLEICKILDPPMGLLNTDKLQSKVKATLQLNSIQHHEKTAQENSQTGNDIPKQQPIVVQQGLGQQPNTSFQLTSVSQELYTTVAQSPTYVIQQQSGNQYQLISRPVSQASGIINPQSQASFFHSNNSQPNTSPNQTLTGQQKVALDTDMSTHFESKCGKNLKSDALKCALPVYLKETEAESGELDDATEPCNFIIKQEPIDYNGDYVAESDHCRDEKPFNYSQSFISNSKQNISCAESSNKMSAEVNDTSSDGVKRKQTEEVSNDCGSEISSKKLKQENNEIENAADEKEEHFAEIEYSFSNDLNKKSVKQEVSVNDDDQTIFSFSGTNKMGKTTNDLDLNLGDYLPDDCIIKPSDIDLKRIITAEGGKMVIRVKYSMNS